MPSWDDYRYFLAVARLGSLSAAARSLGVTQPTVGRRIEQLETAVRHQLFDRQPSGFVLTSSGATVLRHAEQMEHEAIGVENALTGVDAEARPLVRVATTLSLALNWLTERMAMLAQQDQNVRLAVQVGISYTDVRRFQADVALRLGDPGEEALFGRRVGTVHCGLYASRAYLAEHPAPDRLSALACHRIIDSDGEIEHLRQADRFREVAGDAPRALCVDNTSVQLAACLHGFGVATLMCMMADDKPELVRLLREEFDVPLDLWLLINRELRNSPAVRSVFDFLVREAQASADVFQGRSTAQRDSASAVG